MQNVINEQHNKQSQYGNRSDLQLSCHRTHEDDDHGLWLFLVDSRDDGDECIDNLLHRVAVVVSSNLNYNHLRKNAVSYLVLSLPGHQFYFFYINLDLFLCNFWNR